MRIYRLVIVGLVLGLLVTPIAWADSEAGEEQGLWGLDWVDEVVSWVVGLITEGPDPIGTDLELLSPADPTANELQTTSSDEDRTVAIDPAGNKAN